MNAIVIKEFKRRGELQTIGSVIEITEEAVSLLAGYVEAVPTLPDDEPSPCFCCHGQDYWLSRINGDSICRRCHPPAPGAERG